MSDIFDKWKSQSGGANNAASSVNNSGASTLFDKWKAQSNGTSLVGNSAGVGTEIPTIQNVPTLETKSSESANLSVSQTPDIIAEYESIPTYNRLERMFSKEKSDAYKQKQNLYPDYQKAKIAEVGKLVESLGLTEDDLLLAKGNVMGVTISPDVALNKYNLTDAQKKDIQDYALEYFKEKKTASATKLADEHPVLASGMSLVTNPIESGVDTLQTGIDFITGNPISKKTADITQNVRDTVSEDMGTFGKNAYGVGMSIGDMAVAALTGQPGAVMGVEKAASTIRSATERGVDPDKILKLAATSGATTAITEGKVFENFTESFTKGLATKAGESVAKSLAKNVLKSFLAEGTQEVAEGTLDLIADQIIAGALSKENKTELNSQYNALKDAGYSNKEAVGEIVKNLALQAAGDFIGGGVAGSVMDIGALGLGYTARGIDKLKSTATGGEIPGLDFGNLTSESEADTKAIQDRLIAQRIKQEQNANRNVASYSPGNQDIITLTDSELKAAENARNNTFAEEQKANTVPNLTELLQQANQIPTVENATETPLQSESTSPETFIPEAKSGEIFTPTNDVYVKRYDKQGASTSGKPQGLYVSNESTPSPHANENDELSHYVISKDAKFYDTKFSGKVKSPSRNKTPIIIGTTANYLVDKLGLPEVERMLSLKRDAAISEFGNKFPEIDWNRYYDVHEMVEALGGLIARQDGVDVVRTLDTEYAPDSFWNPEDFTEMAVLNDSVLSSANQESESKNPVHKDSAENYAPDSDIPVVGEATVTDIPKEINGYSTSKLPTEYKDSTSTIRSLVNMFARGGDAKLLHAQLIAALNEYAATGSETARNEVERVTAELERRMHNSTYTTQRSKDKRSGKVKKYSYPTNYGTITENVNGLMDSIDRNTGRAISISGMETEISDTLAALNGDKANTDLFNEFLEHIRTAMNDFRENGFDDTMEINKALDVADKIVKNVPDTEKSRVTTNLEQIVTKAFDVETTMPDTNPFEETTTETTSDIPTMEETVEQPKERVKYMAEDIGLRNRNTTEGTRADGSEFVSEEVPFEVNDYSYNPVTDENLSDDAQVRSYGQTMANKTDAPDELKNEFIKNPSLYEQLHNKDTEAKAYELLDSMPDVDTAINDVMRRIEAKEAVAVPMAYMLSNELTDQGRLTEAVNITRALEQSLTEAGQFTQAVVITMLNNNPDAVLNYTQRKIAALNADGRQKFGKKWKDFELTEEERNTFKNLEVGDTQGINDALDLLGQRIAREYPVKMREKILEFRRISMLCNIRTTLRNVGGNLAMLPTRWSAGRISAMYEAIYKLFNKNYIRTESLNPLVDTQKRKAASDYWETRSKELLGDVEKYRDVKSAAKNRQIFKGGAVSKAIDTGLTAATNKTLQFINNATNGTVAKVNEIVSDGGYDSVLTSANSKFGVEGVNPSVMESVRNYAYWILGPITDNPFVKENFVAKLESFMKVNHIDKVEDVPADVLEDITSFILQEANKATFHDKSSVADGMVKLRDALNKPFNNNFVGDLLISFAMTPGNIAARMKDYSPVGLIQSIVDFSKNQSNLVSAEKTLAALKTDLQTAENENVNQAILKSIQNEIENAQNEYNKANSGVRNALTLAGQGTLGTLGVALGYILTEAGALVGKLSDDKDEKKFQEQQGMRAYSVKVGDRYIPIKWLMPAAAPILFGMVLSDSFKESSDTIKKLLNGVYAVGDAWLESSPMSGAASVLEGYGSPTENLVNTITDPSSFVSAQLNAITKSIDPVKRNTTDNTSAFNTAVNKVKARIPGLSETLPAVYDTWGNESTRQNNRFEATLANNFYPGEWVSQNGRTAIDDDIQSIYDATGNEAVFPRVAASSVKDKSGESVKLNNKEYSELQEMQGKTSYKLANNFIKSDYYGLVNDDVRADVLEDMYSVAKAYSENELFGTPIPSSIEKLVTMYKEQGADAVTSYLATADYVSNYRGKGATKSNTTTIPALESLDISDKEKGEFLATYNGVNNTTSAYIENGDYLSVYYYYLVNTKADAAGDKNKHATYDEVVDFLSKSKYSQGKKEKMFKSVYPDKEIPYLK